MLDNRGRVGSNEELDGLGHTVVAEERPRLTPDKLALGGSVGDVEETGSGTVGVGGIGDGFIGSSSEFDIDEIDLELSLGLDTDENGGTTTGDDDLIGVVNRLENEGESSLLRNANVT